MNFLRVTRINNPTSPDGETVYVNADEVKYFTAHEDGGANLHLIHEDLPMQIQECCDDLILQMKADTGPTTP